MFGTRTRPDDFIFDKPWWNVDNHPGIIPIIQANDFWFKNHPTIVQTPAWAVRFKARHLDFMVWIAWIAWIGNGQMSVSKYFPELSDSWLLTLFCFLILDIHRKFSGRSAKSLRLRPFHGWYISQREHGKSAQKKNRCMMSGTFNPANGWLILNLLIYCFLSLCPLEPYIAGAHITLILPQLCCVRVPFRFDRGGSQKNIAPFTQLGVEKFKTSDGCPRCDDVIRFWSVPGGI